MVPYYFSKVPYIFESKSMAAIMNDFEFEVLRTVSLVKKGMTIPDILSKMSSYDCSASELKAILDEMHTKDVLQVQNIKDEDGKMKPLYYLNSNKFKTMVISDILNDII